MYENYIYDLKSIEDKFYGEDLSYFNSAKNKMMMNYPLEEVLDDLILFLVNMEIEEDYECECDLTGEREIGYEEGYDEGYKECYSDGEKGYESSV